MADDSTEPHIVSKFKPSHVTTLSNVILISKWASRTSLYCPAHSLDFLNKFNNSNKCVSSVTIPFIQPTANEFIALPHKLYHCTSSKAFETLPTIVIRLSYKELLWHRTPSFWLTHCTSPPVLVLFPAQWSGQRPLVPDTSLIFPTLRPLLKQNYLGVYLLKILPSIPQVAPNISSTFSVSF